MELDEVTPVKTINPRGSATVGGYISQAPAIPVTSRPAINTYEQSFLPLGDTKG